MDTPAFLAHLSRTVAPSELPEALADALVEAVPDCTGAAAQLRSVRGRTLLSGVAGGTAGIVAGCEGGPWRTAADAGSAVDTPDAAADGRWPELAPLIDASPDRALVCLPLATPRGSVGTLTLHGPTGHRFDDLDLQPLVAYAGLALTAAEKQRNLAAALDSRALIGQAVGILIERRRITADAALALLTRASQASNRKLRDVAADMVETGVDPVIDLRRRRAASSPVAEGMGNR